MTNFSVNSFSLNALESCHNQGLTQKLMFSYSIVVVGLRVIGLLLLLMRNERKLELTAGITPARLGPILLKYLQNLSVIALGSVLNFPFNLRLVSNEGLLVC